MKSDEDVRVLSRNKISFFKMISAEAPVVFAKACELFIVELTHRAWLHTEEGKRRTLQVLHYDTMIKKRKMTSLSALLTRIFSIS